MILTVIGIIVVAVGAAFLFLGGLGIYRLPDVYNRLQAGTKCTTLGAFCAIVGVGIMEPAWLVKCIVIAVFILLTNPIGSHALARAARKSGVPLWEGSVVDKCDEMGQCREPGDGNESGREVES